jgi:hypothetical protein
MDKIEVIVALDDVSKAERRAAVQAAVRVGLAVDPQSRSSELGYLSGSIDASALPKLRAIKGVLSVEKSRAFAPIPPDSDVQ